MSSPHDSMNPVPVHPLAYVGLELRVPFSPRLGAQSTVERLVDILEGDLPVLRVENGQTLTALPDGGMELRQTSGWRMSNRESTRSLLLTPTSLSYEATRYSGFEAFCTDVDRWLRAVEDVCRPVGYDRLGLRYVNEVRPISHHSGFTDWNTVMAPEYINSLAGAQEAARNACLETISTAPYSSDLSDDDETETDDVFDLASWDCRLTSAETSLSFLLPHNAGMTLKLANLDGPGVIGNAPLKRYQLPEPGPFFVVDFDGFWPAQGADVKPFERSEILAQMVQVHTPVKSTFKWATTGSYRREAGVVND